MLMFLLYGTGESEAEVSWTSLSGLFVDRCDSFNCHNELWQLWICN